MGALFRVRLAARAGRKETGASGLCQGNRQHELLFRQEFSRPAFHRLKHLPPIASENLIINFIIHLFSTIFELARDLWVIFCE